MPKNKKHFTEKNIAIYALGISLLSLFISFKGYQRDDKLHKLHLDPTLEFFLIKEPNNDYEFIIKNTSPIPAVNLSVKHKNLIFIKKGKKYASELPAMSSIIDQPGENWLIAKELPAIHGVIGEKSSQIKPQLEFYKDKIILTAIFETTYYRDSDAKEYSNKSIFFLDGRKIYSYKNALKHDFLKEAIEQLYVWESKTGSFMKKIELNRSGDKLIQKAE